MICTVQPAFSIVSLAMRCHNVLGSGAYMSIKLRVFAVGKYYPVKEIGRLCQYSTFAQSAAMYIRYELIKIVKASFDQIPSFLFRYDVVVPLLLLA